MQGDSHQWRHRAGWLAPVLAGFVVGSALQLLQPALWAADRYLALLLPCAALLAWALTRRTPHPWRKLLMGLLCAASAFAMTGWRAALFQDTALAPSLEGRDLLVTGMVAAMPQVDESGARFRFQVESALDDGKAVRLPPRIYLGWYAQALGGPSGDEPDEARSQPSTLQAGERWQVTVRLKAPHGNRNPHGFDYELWLWEQGLQATGYVRPGAAGEAPRKLGQTWRHPVDVARQLVRDRVLSHVADRRTAGWIAALVTGDQNAIERSDWDVFRATGVAHLMSISGLHITMFAWLATAVLGALWRRSNRLCLWLPAPHAAAAGGLLLASAYAVFSGWGVPAQRTVCMLLAVGLLRLSGRQWPWPVVWLLACAVVVAWDPWALMQAGFWLSFVAVGVLFASGPPAMQENGGGWVHRLRGMAREQGVITLALTPLTLLLFGQVSLVGLLANAVAIPWVTLVVTPLAMAGVVWAPLWTLGAWAVGVLGLVLQWFAAWPWAQISLPMAPSWLGALGVAGGALLVLRLPWSLRLVGLPLMLPVLLWQSAAPAAGTFEVLAADVGQGNAVLVRTAHHALLYDAGPAYSRDSDAGGRVLVPLLRALGVELDLLVLSHRDLDHVGGAAAVLAAQPRAALRSSLEPTHPLQALRAGQRCEAGQHWHWDGVDFAVLHPPATDYLSPHKPNAMSCVLRITAAPGPTGAPGAAALLAGDIEIAGEQALVDAGAALKADYLLVPHHGSKTSSSAGFLDAVAPAIAVVQAGYRNRFGHPAGVPMARYRQRGILVVDAAHCGAARWQSPLPLKVQCERQDDMRYWRHIAP